MRRTLDGFCVFNDVPLSRLTTIGIGGAAKTVVCPASTPEVDSLLCRLNDDGVSWFALGRGSNVLACDGDVTDVIIHFDRHMAQIWRDKELVYCQSGAPVKMVCDYMLSRGLSGGEFLAVLPGTAGGALVGNSGCFGQEMSAIVHSVKAARGGEVRTFGRDELCFSYRNSFFKSDRQWVVTEIAFKFGSCDKNSAAVIEEMRSKKLLTQPINARSAGCVFKNKDGYFAARAIDQMGFKGFNVGGARISERHANFIINTGKATCADVLTLIGIINAQAQKSYGISFETEIDFLPRRSVLELPD